MTQVIDRPNEIAPYKPDAPVAYGKRDELAALVARMRVMLKVKDAPDDILYRAAQVCLAYRLMPGEQVHVYKIGGEYVVDTGIDAWKLEAKRQCDKRGDMYSIPTPRIMTQEEVKAQRGDLYDPRDRGAVATLYLKSESRFHKEMGIAYEGHTAMGFWRAKGKNSAVWENNKKTDRKEWKEDTLPETMTAEEVAQRRAIKKVIKQVFALDLDTNSDEGYTISNARLLEERLDTDERERKDTRYTTVPNTQKVSDFTQNMLDSEPLVEIDGEFEPLGEAVEPIAQEDRTVASFVDGVYNAMTEAQQEYAKLVIYGEYDENGAAIARLGDQEQAEKGPMNGLRKIVNDACRWTDADKVYGATKTDILLCVLGGRWAGDKLSMSAAAVSQLRKDLQRTVPGRGDTTNKNYSEAKMRMIQEVSEEIDRLAEEEEE